MNAAAIQTILVKLCNTLHKLYVCNMLIISSSTAAPTFRIIREVYESTNAHERFEAELDKALEAKVDYIIIEPPRLGDETGRWITVGNCLYKTAITSGVASLISSLIWRDRPFIAAPMCAVSLFCTGLYTVSWNYDPCCQYQVQNDDEILSKLPLGDVSAPVILGYSPNTKTKYLHRSVTLLSAAFCAWQIWRSYK
ncbi:transmembrane protein 11 homolog, mitochondrial isoform X1 [Anastrepha ludens]|uniref:transmembrane protein 11 homolog, mitochondrial isoform X1 n=2 Tax=Anastrepha TaxID=28585 RepID=UPI0023B1CDB9|nr:transmembrane protein 11 homolog, mitochondrial isoform X1 [Anastrepha ludens]